MMSKKWGLGSKRTCGFSILLVLIKQEFFEADRLRKLDDVLEASRNIGFFDAARSSFFIFFLYHNLI